MSFNSLDHENFVRMTTFRRDGSAVPTTVWFAREGDHLLVGTGSGSGKLKRLRRDPNVELTACNYRGKLRSGVMTQHGIASILDGEQAEMARASLAAKYGLQWGVMGRKIDTFVAIEAVVSDTSAPSAA